MYGVLWPDQFLKMMKHNKGKVNDEKMMILMHAIRYIDRPDADSINDNV